MSSVFELWIHSIKQFYHIPANSLFITKEIPKDFLDTVIQTREMLRDHYVSLKNNKRLKNFKM